MQRGIGSLQGDRLHMRPAGFLPDLSWVEDQTILEEVEGENDDPVGRNQNSNESEQGFHTPNLTRGLEIDDQAVPPGHDI
jgi:hypothetical protein